MSTLSLRKIKHDSSLVDNITLNSSGHVSTAERLIVNGATTNTNSNWGYYVQPKSGSSLGAYNVTDPTGNYSLMNIDYNGCVTKPQQPWFSAYRNSTVNYTDGQTIIWNATVANSNVGNNYNTSTGRFTAPVTGVYLFRADFRQPGNGAGYFDIRSSTGQVTRHEENSSYPNGYHQTLACMYRLNAGDYVWTQAGGVTAISPDANTTDRFEGYLLG